MLRADFAELQKQCHQDVDEFGGLSSSLYSTLMRWEPFDHKATDWFDSEWMFVSIVRHRHRKPTVHPPRKHERRCPEALQALGYKTYGTEATSIHCSTSEVSNLSKIKAF